MSDASKAPKKVVLEPETLYELENPLDQSVALQVATGDRAKGMSWDTLESGGSRELYGRQFSDQILSLLRNKRGRPPVLKYKEVDLKYKKAMEKKAEDEKKAKAAAKNAAKKANSTKDASSESPKAKKKKAKPSQDQVSPAEVAALEAGDELP